MAADLRRLGEGLLKNRKGVVFLRGGVGTPMHTMNLAITLIVMLIYWCQWLRYSFPWSCNWLATNNNFWCCQELKIKFHRHYLDKRHFLLAVWHMFLFLTKCKLIDKNLLKRSVLNHNFKTHEIWTKKLIFFPRFALKQLQIHDETKID